MSRLHGQRTKVVEIGPIIHDSKKSSSFSGKYEHSLIENLQSRGPSSWSWSITCPYQKRHLELEKRRCLMDSYITSNARIVPISQNFLRTVSKESLLKTILKSLNCKLKRYTGRFLKLLYKLKKSPL